ncbi:hypothetical protein CcCBS67573_g01343 [Chytriomyces confervae]|uniref:Copper homeostasis protein cutC homolog n=1 Tax=Chytriomyces confervae TaxID=246404 RepID=A0A507FM47_9FUNG|nr:hypothetical protein HDU80_001392 [Chytriomyces hyalinus]TPX77394.1 hypothetical protein CcCBS67573_g01343 [Chytriomyces confervae]
MLLEVCVESVEPALAAVANGANRIELCASLAVEGGITPSHGLIAIAVSRIQAPIMVMIRPRSGDFCYTDTEFEAMKLDIVACKQLNASGVVFGILTPDGRVDVPRMKTLLDLSHPMQVTFHRAFDVARDPFEALEDIIQLGGIQRILTSGQSQNVVAGLDTLLALVKQAGSRISIMPGSGVSLVNLDRIVTALPVKEIHMSLMKSVDSPMEYRNGNVNMGSFGRSEYSRVSIDADGVAVVVSKLKGYADRLQ